MAGVAKKLPPKPETHNGTKGSDPPVGKKLPPAPRVSLLDVLAFQTSYTGGSRSMKYGVGLPIRTAHQPVQTICLGSPEVSVQCQHL